MRAGRDGKRGAYIMELLTVRQAAKHLAVAEITVRRLIESGDLRAHRIGRAVRIPVDSIQSYLEAHTWDGAA